MRSMFLAVAALSVGAVEARAQSGVGSPAPAVEPTEWINTPPTTWKELKGRLILLEKWATW